METTVNIGEMIDNLVALRDEKRTKQAEIDEVDKQYRELEQELLEVLEAQGIDKATGTSATASRKVSSVCAVKDWDAFYNFIHRHKHYHLLQRRVSEPAWREIMEISKKVPGTEPFHKVSLGLTVR